MRQPLTEHDMTPQTDTLLPKPETSEGQEAKGGCLHHACSSLDAQRNALAEARLRIIARYEHVETWLKQPAMEETLANWAGIVEGLRQARRIIGGMWDELPVPKPQAVIDHEKEIAIVMKTYQMSDLSKVDLRTIAERHGLPVTTSEKTNDQVQGTAD